MLFRKKTVPKRIRNQYQYFPLESWIHPSYGMTTIVLYLHTLILRNALL